MRKREVLAEREDGISVSVIVVVVETARRDGLEIVLVVETVRIDGVEIVVIVGTVMTDG